MNDAAYCAYGCPPGKRCHVADPNFGCVLGDELLTNPRRPRCCEVEDHNAFIDTAFAILEAGNSFNVVQQNAGTAGIRQALGALLVSFGIGGHPPQASFYETLTIRPGQFVPRMVDDLVKLLQKMMPDSGFSVDMEIYHIARQPREWRENPNNSFYSMVAPLQNLPSNALTLAATLEVWPRNVTAAKVVSLVLHALANPDPWPTSDVKVRLEHGLTSLINRHHITLLRAAVQTTRFVGRLEISSLPDMCRENVQFGQFQVAPGKDIEVDARTLEITIA